MGATFLVVFWVVFGCWLVFLCPSGSGVRGFCFTSLHGAMLVFVGCGCGCMLGLLLVSQVGWSRFLYSCSCKTLAMHNYFLGL